MTRHKSAILCAGFAALVASSAVATAQPATPASVSEILPLYPKGTITPLPVPEIREDLQKNGQINIRNVSEPTLEIFKPAPGTANGIAVIVAPGGGFVTLVYDNEGTAVARRLAQQGITAFVLKYRLSQTPADPIEMQAEHMKAMGGVMARAMDASASELPRFAGEERAVKDAARAVRIVRDRAAGWGLDPLRVGFIGFSAGAFAAVDVAIGDPAGRPDFVGVIYGALRTPVPKDAPPAFIATAANDEFLPNDPVSLYDAWKAAGRSAELHIYERGGHGFGMTQQGASSDHWFDEFIWWLQSRGLMKPVGAQPAR
ncbi:alpha/beta hydrolase [Sphingomonas oligophenolica]|uniref:Alpha/beta hydrolase n=2 Tax=Sphingomonas oligophenolica TaxID=301154 RepID=A0ABU9YBP9_9SPHN